MQSRIENDANRKMHRGTLDELLFSGGEAIERIRRTRLSRPFRLTALR